MEDLVMINDKKKDLIVTTEKDLIMKYENHHQSSFIGFLYHRPFFFISDT